MAGYPSREMMCQVTVAIIKGDSYRIQFTDEEDFVGLNEETGDEVKFAFEDVDLERDQLYKLVLMNP